MNLQKTLETLLEFDPNSKIIESAVLCEFSSDDLTPTIHLTLWRGHALSDIPDTGLNIATEGFCDIGRVYSLKPKNQKS